MQTKICKKCGKELPATSEYFRRDKSTPDGLRYRCKKCKSEDDKEYHIRNKEAKRKYYIENKEKINLQQRKYYIENKEKIAITVHKYYENNKQKILAYGKNYRDKNKQYFSDYVKANKERYRIHNQKRRATIKSIRRNLTIVQWKFILSSFNQSCAYCGKPSKRLTQEHFIPVSRHGEYTKHNIIPSCKSCNSSKQDKPFEEWYPEQPFYSKERERFIYEHFTKMAEENGGWGRSRSDLGTLTIIINEQQAI